MTLRETLFAAAKQPVVTPVSVAQWIDQPLFIRVLTGTELDKYTTSVQKAREDNHYAKSRATLVALALCDADGTPVASLDDVPAICDWNGKLLDKLFEAAFKANQIGVDESEEVEKN